MSSTDNDWMRQIEEDASFIAELDDFEDEKREVLNHQGLGFQVGQGYWLSQFMDDANSHDLDALYESKAKPFTKVTLDNLLGRKTTPQEYDYYFRNHPNAHLYQDLYQEFCGGEAITAHQSFSNTQGGLEGNNQSSNFASNNNYNPSFWSQNPNQNQNTNQFGNQTNHQPNHQPNHPTYNNRPGFGR